MHRKYLRGKRNKSNQVPTAAHHKDYKMVQSEIPQMPEFLSRVANIPVVHTAIDYASDAYEKAKVVFNNLYDFCNISNSIYSNC